MENVYRRNNVSRTRVERISSVPKFSIKGFVVRQTMICTAILIGVSFLATTPEDSMIFQKNAIRYILEHNTDIREFPEKSKEFLDKYIFDKTAQNSKGKEALIGMVAPTNGELTSPFGIRLHPVENVDKFHYGVDISAPEGTKVLCAQKGEAKEISENSEYGKYIVVDHGDGISSLYAHLSDILASVGDEIEAGQMIAHSGSTGNVTGPHLHFEIKDGDEWLNPEEFIHFATKTAE